MGAQLNGAVEAVKRRPWHWLLIALFCLSAGLLLYLRANIGFFLDDWFLILLREGPGDWMLPHNEHIIILPAAVYELSLSLFGMEPMPIHLLALVLFLTSVALLYQWLRPLVGEPASVLGSAVVLFLGAAAGDLVFAFQIGFFGSVVGGLGALLLIRRETIRSDLMACLALVISTLCSTLMAPFLAAALVQLLFRGDERPDLRRLLRSSWIVLVPVLVYLVWWAGFNQEGSQQLSLENAIRTPQYVLAAIGFGGASLTGAFPLRAAVENYLWVLPGIAIAIGFVWILRRRGKVPPEFYIGLAAGLGFWALCALNYTPAREFFTSRYQYPSVIFLLMMLAGAFKGLRPDSRQLKWLGGLAAISIVINIGGLFYAFNDTYKRFEEQNLVNLAAVDLASETVNPRFAVSMGTDGRGDIGASSILNAIERFGRPQISEDFLSGASAGNRARLDQLLVTALPVEVIPAARVIPDRQRCRTVRADPEATETLDISGPLSYIVAERDVVIRLGRYGDRADAVAWAAPAGKAVGYRIPPDRSRRPWRIAFQGSGKVTLCPATTAS